MSEERVLLELFPLLGVLIPHVGCEVITVKERSWLYWVRRVCQFEGLLKGIGCSHFGLRSFLHHFFIKFEKVWDNKIY